MNNTHATSEGLEAVMRAQGKENLCILFGFLVLFPVILVAGFYYITLVLLILKWAGVSFLN
jgi:hypothetical protein